MQDDTSRTFATGSVRDTAKGKPRMSLVPTEELMRVAKHFTNGAEKYGENNWKLGQPTSVLYDSAQRHLTKWWSGETDEDHCAAAIWNIMAAMWIEKHKPELDDRKNFE